MDTDWCIVCDSRIYPANAASETSKASKTSQGITEVTRDYAIQSCPSAFCSTNCLLKAYREAEVYRTTEIQSQTSDFHYSISSHPSSHRRPYVAPKMDKAFRNRPSLPLGNCHSESPKNKSKEKKLISQFTFGSYGSSPLSSSNFF
ncbi:hypothetical protein PCANC_13236 [Puccinia coronata f. sp. avenae]|uniref:Uncharacterized protein n=1 Tax=Puccinia coronata f. sp. avenae TaxID=200324 RepID=A0A2N5SZD6_9BASI|nr:hypothetical protein PCASD_12790 [Puccinia coronata f. sp. avenae]PLW43574.1 hypothetical protein PCANC_13236 [Puccinia coronata f. sp. avenae]